MKYCNKCKTNKTEDEFHWRNKSKGTKKAWCRSCVKDYDVLAYKEGKKKGNSKISKEALWLRNQKFLLSYLNAHPCIDCKNDDIRVLEFDHLRDKKYLISSMRKSYSIETLIKEIEKCDVVCANCHKIRTYTRKPNYRTINLNL